ncbi:molybdopterin-dependent oxidoreductase [Rudaea sp.]|uniref:molybdopterin-dependent oxidoreductase n=1 Tax=Rudaea sp. TaxID=2136325 RepID=UPI00321FC2F5
MLKGGLITAAGFATYGSLSKLAERAAWLAPDNEGLYGFGESVTYAAQRLLMAPHSMAREFTRADLSRKTRVNHGHPDDEFYERLLRSNFNDWRLQIDGMVARPRDFSLAELKAMPRQTQITELICEEGWSFVAAWTGVPLSILLNAVGASPAARWVVFHPFDDFWGSIDIAEALHPQTLLAYAMNGEDLSADHGAPVRLRVPRQLGYKNLKYIARITLVDQIKNIGDGNGSAAVEIGYSWYGGI